MRPVLRPGHEPGAANAAGANRRPERGNTEPRRATHPAGQRVTLASAHRTMVGPEGESTRPEAGRRASAPWSVAGPALSRGRGRTGRGWERREPVGSYSPPPATTRRGNSALCSSQAIDSCAARSCQPADSPPVVLPVPSVMRSVHTPTTMSTHQRHQIGTKIGLPPPRPLTGRCPRRTGEDSRRQRTRHMHAHANR